MANYRDIRYNFGSTAEIHTDFGNMILLEKIIASGDETISFTDKIDSSYKEYIFSFIKIMMLQNLLQLIIVGIMKEMIIQDYLIMSATI